MSIEEVYEWNFSLGIWAEATRRADVRVDGLSRDEEEERVLAQEWADAGHAVPPPEGNR